MEKEISKSSKGRQKFSREIFRFLLVLVIALPLAGLTVEKISFTNQEQCTLAGQKEEPKGFLGRLLQIIPGALAWSPGQWRADCENWITRDGLNGHQICSHYGETCEAVRKYTVTNVGGEPNFTLLTSGPCTWTANRWYFNRGPKFGYPYNWFWGVKDAYMLEHITRFPDTQWYYAWCID